MSVGIIRIHTETLRRRSDVHDKHTIAILSVQVVVPFIIARVLNCVVLVWISRICNPVSLSTLIAWSERNTLCTNDFLCIFPAKILTLPSSILTRPHSVKQVLTTIHEIPVLRTAVVEINITIYICWLITQCPVKIRKSKTMTHLMTEDTDTSTYRLAQIATCSKLICNTNYINGLILVGLDSSVIPTCRPNIISVTAEVCTCSCIEYIDEIHITVIVAVIL